jgi:hypothetical protein
MHLLLKQKWEKSDRIAFVGAIGSCFAQVGHHIDDHVEMINAAFRTEVRPFKNEALVLPSKRATLAGDYKIAA